ncbi:MAG: 4-hydroxy-tetrahydrodipicolinate reductase [Chloroflexi bacterium]|nr:4-hydroxy-tetrahydrodipicolinate reductase [Chloroflexota bacterium]|tara:strand:+ start:22928 stop:23734 length:807 start_codon:yes stop_codon:yes gene_type:complete
MTNNKEINVLINGIHGKMGSEVLNAVCKDSSLNLIAGIDKLSSTKPLIIPGQTKTIQIENNINKITDLSEIDVIIDFTNKAGAMEVIRTAVPEGIRIVSGSTGFDSNDYEEINDLAEKFQTGIFIAPNFTTGAILLMHFAKIAARFFDYADINEVHHEAKIDSPSGTAIAIAKSIIDGKKENLSNNIPEKEIIKNSRGANYKGINIHSGRMPGRVAHHELVFGAPGQTLTIKHDSINRESFMPAVIESVKFVIKSNKFTIGLENIMKL